VLLDRFFLVESITLKRVLPQ